MHYQTGFVILQIYVFLPLCQKTNTPYGLSVVTLFWIVITAAAYFILRFTMLGREIYALGGDINSAETGWISSKKASGLCIFFYGIHSWNSGSLYRLCWSRLFAPNSIVGKELDVIAAVVLGGASLSGGIGTVGGTILGVVLIAIVKKRYDACEDICSLV